MKKSWVQSRFGASFLAHIERFIIKMDLLPKSGKGFVAVSGGADSMALLYVLNIIFHKKGLILEALHVNHGTRSENEVEEKLVRNFCESADLGINVKNLNLNSNVSNFEKIAREERKSFFLEQCKEGDVVYTGHHLDDSFEWSLMQKLKTSSKVSSLGIAVINRPFARPFMAASKKHIMSFLSKEKIYFLEDPSNLDDRYERNYLRKHVIPLIAKKYPKYLKHYSDRSNELAQEWKISRKNNIIGSHFQKTDPFGGIFLINSKYENNFLGKEEVILGIIKHLSQKGRGVLKSQVQKLIQASVNGQKGPLSFSGGVKGFILQGCLYLASNNVLKKWKDLDKKILGKMVKNSFEGLGPELVESQMVSELPIVFWDKKNLKLTSMKRPHPLLYEATKLALTKGISFQELSRLEYLENKNKK